MQLLKRGNNWCQVRIRPYIHSTSQVRNINGYGITETQQESKYSLKFRPFPVTNNEIVTLKYMD